MRAGYVIALMMLVIVQVHAATNKFTLCNSKYALCTFVPCDPVPGKKDVVSCHCNVKEAYSFGTKSCDELKEVTKGQSVSSRYSPINEMVICSNERPWAFCLDSPCVVDSKDPTKADCLCSLVANKGPYAVSINTDGKSECTNGIYSSATIKDINEATAFLKTHKELPPLPIKIIQDK
jgi:hypothetical protein